MRRLAVLVILVGLAACGGDDAPPTCLPDCPAVRTYDALAYDLRASFDFTEERLSASERITVALADSPIIELDADVEIIGVHSEAGELAYRMDAETQLLHVDLTPLGGASPVTFTVDYHAAAGDALRVGGPRDDDPVLSRMVYTNSEPNRGHQWLVSKDDPSDRALFSVAMEVDATEDAIGNGARVADSTEDGRRTVRYALDKSIPTYLMAFAAGDLVHADRTTGRVPLALWYRAGLPIDPDATLDMIEDAMTTFEGLVGPYPWDTYSVVLAPGYGGGMENATITLNAETSSLGRPSFGLNAHELAHHWFGDWVTMHRYDDAWVKEGMATLLAAEADRARRDRTPAADRRFGTDFTFSPGEAIVDTMKHGLEKYDSGPYERAAWLLTQIRSIVGEDAFWAALRGVLSDHALGTITGEEFIAAFPLDPAVAAQAVASLPVHGVPTLRLTQTTVTGGTELELLLDDSDRIVLAPIGVTVVDGAGVATTTQLVRSTPVTVTVPDDGYLALDEADVHPYLYYSFNPAGDFAAFNLGAPRGLATPAALAAFTSRSAAVQERLLPPTPPADITALYAALDSTIARRSAVINGCNAIAGGLGPEGFAGVLVPLVDQLEVATYTTSFGWCGPMVAAAFAGELGALMENPTPETAGRLDYLLALDYGAGAALAQIGWLADNAPTLRLRDRAIGRLVSQAQGYFYTAPTGGDRTGYTAFFRAKLGAAASETRVLQTWGGAYNLGDLGALPILADRIEQVALRETTQLGLVCDAYVVSGGGAGWPEFQDALRDWGGLATIAAATLDDPSRCFDDDKRATPAPALLRRTRAGELAREVD
jgi:aminopeptidase N